MRLVSKYLKFYTILVIFQVAVNVKSSKLNQIVLISSDVIFDRDHFEHAKAHTNLTSPDKLLNQEGNEMSWENEGFLVANATQISSSLGHTVNGSTHLLLATKPACLTTHLKKFEHTFLSIKFSSIIGQSVPITPEDHPTTTTTTSRPTTLGPQKSTPPSILKLNTGNTDGTGHHVIEIAIDSHTHLPDNNSVPKPKTRRKRTLNSEELSQIHKIIYLAANTTKEVNGKNKSVIAIGDSLPPNDAKVHAIPNLDSKPHLTSKVTSDQGTIAKKLPYETWRASMDKSFRPPGFYVTVDDKVLFDSWIGTWKNPSVMGRWIPPTRKKIWNETEILVQFDEDPDQDIKINFEWEPTDANSYLFLSNITISTYGANTTVQNIIMNSSLTGADKNQNTFSDGSSISGVGNKNITLYIVVKSHDDDPIPVDVSKNNPSTEKSNIENGSNSKSEKESKESTEKKNAKKTEEPKKGSPTGLIVAIFTGIISLIIMIFLIHKKLQLSKRQGRGC